MCPDFVNRGCARLAVVTLLASMTWVPSQAQQTGSQEPPPPTIRVNTRLVLVDVVDDRQVGQLAVRNDLAAAQSAGVQHREHREEKGNHPFHAVDGQGHQDEKGQVK